MEAEVAVGFFGDDVSGAEFATGGGWVVGHDGGGTGVDGVGHDFPLDGKGRGEAGALPVGPFVVEEGAGAVDEDVCAGFGFEADAGGGIGGAEERGSEEEEGEGETAHGWWEEIEVRAWGWEAAWSSAHVRRKAGGQAEAARWRLSQTLTALFMRPRT